MDFLNNLSTFVSHEDFTPIHLLYALIACALAILMGTRLAKKQARAFTTQSHGQVGAHTLGDGDLPQVNHIDYGDMRFLHLGTPWVQGSMKISKPFEIHLDYVQRMMGWLLFADLDRLPDGQAMQLGLGAASLTKFCHAHLHMHTTAVELNPQVVATCRLWFNLPEDNAKLHVMVANAAQVVTQAQWHEKVDALQVDLYDQEADRPVLDSEAFYADCKQLLTPQGCMAVNLYGRNANVQASIQKIAHVFGKDALWKFKPTAAGNTVVLAFRTPRVLSQSDLMSRAQTIQKRWPLPAKKWVKVLAPHG